MLLFTLRETCALNRLSSIKNLRGKGGKFDHRPGRPKVLLRHWTLSCCISITSNSLLLVLLQCLLLLSCAYFSSFKYMYCTSICCILYSVYRRVCRLRKDVIYQAIWAENASFDQILVSPTMFSDHMPTVMFSALTMVSQAACLFCLAADYH